MTRRVRIGIELFGPGLIAGLLINLVWGAIAGWQTLAEGRMGDLKPNLFAWAGLVIFAAYCFSGLQSIAYMAVMEWRFARGLDPESWSAVRLSAGLGFLSTMVLFGFQLIDRWTLELMGTGVVFGGFGLAVGFLTGLLVKRWSAGKTNVGGNLPFPPIRRHHPRSPANPRRIVAATGLMLLPALAWWTTRDLPAWVTMWALAGSLFFALKLLTLTAVDVTSASPARMLAYVALWPGMDAGVFLTDRPDKTPLAPWGELAFATIKLLGGLLACAWAAHKVGAADPLLVGWVGMVGIIFTLHFGLLHVTSWLWRRAGVNAPPIMRAPIVADSLADFWGGRWNAAFADAARRFLFKPTVRTLGVGGAGALVFLVSGLVHETVISLPARGGWGGPTLYFLLQGAGMVVEKSGPGRRLSLGADVRGWLWMALCTAGPLPLLFHAPFVHRVIVPLFETLNRFLP